MIGKAGRKCVEVAHWDASEPTTDHAFISRLRLCVLVTNSHWSYAGSAIINRHAAAPPPGLCHSASHSFFLPNRDQRREFPHQLLIEICNLSSLVPLLLSHRRTLPVHSIGDGGMTIGDTCCKEPTLMPTLLHLDSSPLGEASISRNLSQHFVEALTEQGS
jgi:hypothetical protein